jgi:hypothetical protein
MPDMIGTPVGAMIQPPDPMQGVRTLSGIIGIQQQKQQLQTGQYLQQTAQSGAIKAQQEARETQAGASLLSDPVGNGILEADGKTPTQNAQSIIMRTMPTTGAARFGDIVKAAQGKVEFDNAKNNLNLNERQAYNSAVAGAAAGAQSPQDIKDASAQFLEATKGSPVAADYETMDKHLNTVLDHASKQPTVEGQVAPWRQTALQYGRSVLGAPQTVGANGIGAPAATTIQTSGGVQGGVQAPPLQGGGLSVAGAPVMNAPPPGVTQAPSGALVRTGAGGIGGGAGGGGPPAMRPPAGPAQGPQQIGRINGRPRTAQDDAPPPNAPTATQQQFAASAKAANEQVANARSIDDQYGTNMSIAHTIRHLSADTNTGPGTAAWTRGMGVLSSQAGGSEAVANYQTLGSFLDRQAAGLRQQMNIPETNMGQATAQLIGGTTEYQRGAIQAKNNLNEALTEGAHLYRQGLDRVEGFTGNASPQAVQQFKSVWAQNFDPVAQEYKLAVKRGDTEAAQKIVSGLSPEERKTLAAKGRAIDDLTQGYFPK